MRRAFVRLTAAGTVQDFHLASLSNFPKKILTIKSAAKLQFFFDCSGSVKIFSNQPTIHSKVFFFSSWAARLLAIRKGRGYAHGLLYSLYPLSATRRRRAFRLYCACASLGAKPQRSSPRSLFASKRPHTSAPHAMPAAIPAAYPTHKLISDTLIRVPVGQTNRQ